MTITLDTDGVSAQFDIKDRLSAAEVDVLIRDPGRHAQGNAAGYIEWTTQQLRQKCLL
ncbi:hypothetical protein ACU4GD_07050 [Cupriavidus basilensis]